jgi:hypothetical protein
MPGTVQGYDEYGSSERYQVVGLQNTTCKGEMGAGLTSTLEFSGDL